MGVKLPSEQPAQTFVWDLRSALLEFVQKKKQANTQTSKYKQGWLGACSPSFSLTFIKSRLGCKQFSYLKEMTLELFLSSFPRPFWPVLTLQQSQHLKFRYQKHQSNRLFLRITHRSRDPGLAPRNTENVLCTGQYIMEEFWC